MQRNRPVKFRNDTPRKDRDYILSTLNCLEGCVHCLKSKPAGGGSSARRKSEFPKSCGVSGHLFGSQSRNAGAKTCGPGPSKELPASWHLSFAPGHTRKSHGPRLPLKPLTGPEDIGFGRRHKRQKAICGRDGRLLGLRV